MSYSLPDSGTYESTKGWILTATQAKALLDKGALLLDARKKEAFDGGHIPNAVQVWWRMFSPTDASAAGTLLKSDAELQKKLQELGVSNDTTVVVAGDALNGWGEDGRIAWMLRTLGHNKVFIVNGGISALLQQGLTSTKEPSSPRKGNFTIARKSDYDVRISDVQTLFKQKDVVLVDTREAREYKGETPYGETRGGHVPGAVHLWFRDFLDVSGFLLPKEQLLKKLKEKGITPDKRIVAYCTGGIRSAWFLVVLVDLGFENVQNYAGSMWEWAAAPAGQHPLVTGDGG